ncbi:MAG: AAA family ATPase, partial [Pseudomonadota bacterium]
AAEGLAEAERYVDLVRKLARPPTPSLIAVGGLSGTGKTTLAHALAPTIGNAPGAVVVRSDVLRKRRHGVDLFSKLPEKAYTRVESAAVYEELFATVAGCLASGVTVIADAVFRNADERAAIRDVAAAAGVPFAGIWLEVSDATQDDRLRRRMHDVSDATVAIGRAQRDNAGPVSDWPALNADKPLADLRQDAATILADAGVSVTEG